MTISNRKITTYADNMKDVPVIPDISGTELLAKMDSRTDNEVKTSHNGLIDDLMSTTDGSSGADNIGSTALKSGGATTVQGQLEELTTDKLGDGDLINAITASRTDKVPTEKAIADYAIAIGAGDMLRSVYDPTGKNQDIFEYTDEAVAEVAITIANNLTETAPGKALDATQGKIIDDKITAFKSDINTSLSIQQRDILHIKMRQAGLNLDPNAWSDTLEDITGINTSLSTGYVLTTSKSITTSSTGSYTQESMTYSDGLACSSSLTKMAQSFQVQNTNVISKIKFKTGATHSTVGVVNVRIETDNAGNPSGTLANANAYKNNVSVTAAPNTEYEVDLTGQFTPVANTTYHLVFVYVSGSTYLGCALNNPYALGQMKYFTSSWTQSGYLTSDIAFGVYQVSPSSPATVVWNSVTSEGVITKAVVESVQTLGTGSITYYISRDGGTTFTACTLDAITSISTQPSGTSIVLKVVLTGNAELFAVAWGGQL